MDERRLSLRRPLWIGAIGLLMCLITWLGLAVYIRWRQVELAMDIWKDLPNVSGILLTLIGTAMFFLSETGKWLEERRRTRKVIAGLFVALGIGGIVAGHIDRKQSDIAHQQEVREMNEKLTTVQTQVTSVLTTLVPKGQQQSAESTEAIRRQGVLSLLRNQFILSHKDISPGLMAGTEFPPPEWMNKRLHELGENWTFSKVVTPTKTVTVIRAPSEPARKANIEFSFYSNDPDEWPIKTTTATVEGVKVSVDVTFKAVGDVTAKNGEVWFRICRFCMFASEPTGFQKDDFAPLDRRRHFDSLYPEVINDKITLEIIVPLDRNIKSFSIAGYYACENCPNLDPKKPQTLTVKLSSPKQP